MGAWMSILYSALVGSDGAVSTGLAATEDHVSPFFKPSAITDFPTLTSVPAEVLRVTYLPFMSIFPSLIILQFQFHIFRYIVTGKQISIS